MRNSARAIVVALLALIGSVVMGLSVTTSTTLQLQLLSSYALKGAQVPVFNIESDQSIQALALQYGGTHGVTTPVKVVDYPASWRPFSPGGFSSKSWDQSVREGVTDLRTDIGTDPNPVIFGYSQGAVTASEYKKQLKPGDPLTKFVLLGNGDRPNGGILARFAGIYIPGLDMTATGATPTTQPGWNPGDPPTTIDIAGQYDPIADAPLNPLNPFAMSNSMMGTLFVHLNYANLDPSQAVLQDTVGDTEYYLIPTYPVPLLVPVQMIPGVGPIAADMLDPLVRMLVETGYDRTISPGTPTKANFLYFPNPITLISNIPVALGTGLDNGLQDVGAGRVLNTPRPNITGPTGQDAYGIGGPPVTIAPPTTPLSVTPPVNNYAKSAVVEEYPPQPPSPPAVDPSTITNKGLNLSVLGLSGPSAPGQTGTNATKPSKPSLANVAGSVVSGVTQSIKAVTNAVKDAAQSLKPKTPSTAGTTGGAAAGAG
jgi:pimeloyl-ACP methyl ester carboxylesterase